jgi:transcriptional regulator with XRE-family HTH domain
MTLGERIRAYRKRNGLSQEAFGARFGVERGTVNRWEMGHTEPALIYRKDIERLVLTLPERMLSGIIRHVEFLEAPATLLDGGFRVLRTSRPHQTITGIDPTAVYGRHCERYMAPDMEKVIRDLGGFDAFRRLGVVSLDLTIVHHPKPNGTANTRPRVSIGRTVAIGDPQDPAAYLTTLRLGDPDQAPAPPVIETLDGFI